MAKVLPPSDLTKHLQWSPNADDPPLPPKTRTFTFGPEDVVNHGEMISGRSAKESLEKAIAAAAGNFGNVIIGPTLIGAKTLVPFNHFLWQTSFALRSEEIYGVDEKGVYGPKGEPILVVLHGVGLLPNELSDFIPAKHLMKMSQENFNAMVEFNILPNGGRINLYPINEITNIPGLYGYYGIVLNNAKVMASSNGFTEKYNDFITPLNVARAGGLDYLEEYFKHIITLSSVGMVQSENPYLIRLLPKEPEVRLLQLLSDGFVRTRRAPGMNYLVIRSMT